MEPFLTRHIGPTESDRESMLSALGVGSLDALTDAAVPRAIQVEGGLDLAPAVSEAQVQADLTRMAALNNPLRSMIGQGYHGTITPPVIRRNLLENPAWYTAYTPYQPEISQGRLEMLLTFQTLVADLTGLPTSGASLLDEGTAVAEAVGVARRSQRKGSVVLVDAGILDQSLAVMRTRALALDIEVVVTDDLVAGLQRHDCFAVVVQTPAADGSVRDLDELRTIAAKAHENNALVIAAADLLALTLLPAPAEWGADIAVGSTQRLGVPLFYGGPHAGYIAVGSGMERQMPGRLVGLSKDRNGTPALRLALQTREQHIRREKATSNICTAQVLLAVTAAAYAVYHGPEGLRAIAGEVARKARRLAAAIVAGGGELVSDRFFDTITVKVQDAPLVVREARAKGVHLWALEEDLVSISVGEDVTEDELAAVASLFSAHLGEAEHGSLGQPERETPYLTHPVFHSYRSETQMMRYLRALSDRDFALDRGMIPLGSCTMKLNPAASMEPISYPGFANLHPFVPLEDARGYTEMIGRLEAQLCEITGYDRVSLQPNSGAQGEFAGLMAVRSYHRARGEEHRTVCLIPASAHGTNAASAAMAGMDVVVVKTAPDGTVDFDDLEAKIAKHAEKLSVIMITYPSTHGVYEARVAELCGKVHEAGGQVYIDGANMNALVGLAQPGRFGGDVSHLNLHKTFSIPHGGGGPGVGPVAVREHLAPYLPSHPVVRDAGPVSSYGPISAAPWGSAGVLPITYGYIAMMGPDLKLATQVAVLSANYLAKRLAERFPILYTGDAGWVAHECIVDLRPLTKETGITVDDVAKRLIDYGFHAPTMSFPVAGTLMVEPTESEPLVELDRFVDAMHAIADEAARVKAGEWPSHDNPLVNAPHTLAEVAADEWTHPYPRSAGGFPAGQDLGGISTGGRDKYWPPVARIDGAWGDRNLVCSCPPMEAYAD
ncbi:glycine dehydrogenase (aminomethyl-transferring) [Propioniciclava sinopodophylli]|uniref:Glycine dehydrogenase (decarboxylating) n=1 Tax=Propioniciclava sinopodophylli TaxID=1837344 RepID=A0A4Q9KE27_9ACTN|nr:aminomethyl-transferring glycine dehydrogenase [Propioniciclava sinopodophylli]TBT85370.1 glycine dehydrogenase (aminomethyl-transferring) [Propioniciclava sinopodophylli]